MNFKGKTVVMTGGNGGIGMAAGLKFIKAGATVIGLASDEKRLMKSVELAQEINEKYPENGEMIPVLGDVTNPDDVKRTFQTALEKTGKVDILVVNIEAMDHFIPVGQVSDERWYKVLFANLTAPMLMMREAVDIMVKQPEGGVIVNVGSMASLNGGASGAASAASKHGLTGLTKNTAAIYRSKNIRCNLVAPAETEKQMNLNQAGISDDSGYPTVQKALEARKDGCINPEDIADVILFLCSDCSKAINGAVIPVDNGFSAY